MTTKNLQFYGMGYRTQDTEQTASVNVVFNGNVVYNGTVQTKDLADFNRIASAQAVLFSFDVDKALSGDIPMSITCTGGDMVDVQQIMFTAVLQEGNVGSSFTSSVNSIADARSNVFIDSVEQIRGPNADAFPTSGAWSYSIPKFSTMTCNVNILPFTLR